MPSHRPLAEELVLLNRLHPLVTAKQEIAVMRITTPREKVLEERAFFRDLLAALGHVRRTYHPDITRAQQGRQGQAVVLFSTDTHLTGPVTAATFHYFLEYLHHQAADPVVIGLVGQERFRQALPGTAFAYFQISPQWSTQVTSIIPLVEHLLHYEYITFIYGQYVNMLHQYPVHVTMGEMEEQSSGGAPERYLFEPSLMDIVSLFDRNLIALLLRQAAAENDLAQLGSQITAMDHAGERIAQRLQILTRLDREAARQDRNRRARAGLAGMKFWKARPW